ncbi:MAPEG family protein [Leptospira sp. 2 VSF19]|uniref:MAPEG family protein n=1 Tax=Leptospira soteropolitanensis TaxID=2950025 RepID=A0AAW5VAJ2_9LEPT|nr:MAPEG family protein [Leptospira soteropolitanensis]MCW7491876.1 MAPEG family protein [Leptospira soteropolitanensis]MCW7499460.1 MAPEG family protein [Leptospira soteropolitanensis]MCW7520949.1 MAPEG family protein [Leptospira soteropolitanensis]MCW7525564.1 MAPEG family protein [Leptospira soteropolitanensis]MCW7529430.1 MAPEG family protein [Leptospira soteropolitanensis]
METIYFTLIGFALWTLGLGVFLTSYRSVLVLIGKKKSNEFPAGIQHGTDFNWRLNRAHLNSLENLPIFLTVVYLTASFGKIDSFANQAGIVIIGARVLQSLTHLTSTGVLAVNIRFTFYMIQIVTYIVLLVRLF